MFKSPVLYLDILMGAGAMTFPVYAFFKYRQFFGGNPMFDINY